MPTPGEISQSSTIAATHPGTGSQHNQDTNTLVNGDSNPSMVLSCKRSTTTLSSLVNATAIDQAQPSSTDNSSSLSSSSLSHAHKAPADKCRRAEFVHHLVDCATQVIESIWPAPPPSAIAVKLLPLRLFVQEVLRRSRTSYVTLQTALFYLTRVHNNPWTHHMTKDNCSFILDSATDVSGTSATTAHNLIDIPSATVFATTTTTTADTTTTTTVEDSNEGMATPPDSQRGSSPALTSAELELSGRFPTTSATHAIEARLTAVAATSSSASTTGGTNMDSTTSSVSSTMSSSDPRQCGRRMFLASLVIATKYLQDRAYSNRAWSRVSGLSASEITRCERKLLSWLSWNLYIPDKEFSDFQTDLLARVNAAGHANTAASKPAVSAPVVAQTTTTSIKSASMTVAASCNNTLAPTRAYSATIPLSKDILLKASTAGRSVSLPVSKVSPTPPSPCTPGIVIGHPRHGFASPTSSPHPCAAETTATNTTSNGDDCLDRMKRKRPRSDNETYEQMIRDILTQRPRTAAVATTGV